MQDQFTQVEERIKIPELQGVGQTAEYDKDHSRKTATRYQVSEVYFVSGTRHRTVKKNIHFSR